MDVAARERVVELGILVVAAEVRLEELNFIGRVPWILLLIIFFVFPLFSCLQAANLFREAVGRIVLHSE